MVDFLHDFAAQNNAIIGACHAAPLEIGRLMASPFVPFVSRDINKRTNPSASLKDAQSIIVIGVPQPLRGAAECASPENTALLSSLGADEDYHVRVKGLLQKLAAELKIHYGDFRHKILVDSSGLDERALAHRAGLGFFGRNGLIISTQFGSRFNIGCMLTSIPIDVFGLFVESDSSHKKCPSDCKLCIEFCPGNALETEHLNPTRCVSYLTQKDELNQEESALIKNQLYGCDICQDICPFNAPRETVLINPETWLTMDDDAFKKQYENTAMLWRGTNIPRRNAKIVQANLT